MWNSCAKFSRLKNALKMRGLDPNAVNIDDLANVLRKRGITDTVQNRIVWEIISLLEPPSCPMSHCKHFGHSTAPMNCSLGRVPGKCEILKEYRVRKKAREEAKARKEAERDQAV